uniref:Wsv199-like protein n=1 Tax=Pasiphaea japonica whispovirus TaxID=2984286 RepID=A0A9C7CEU6_9VIRU|nr:MAG: wsv199-like protein [Pasiphaea japonica whispovirus]
MVKHSPELLSHNFVGQGVSDDSDDDNEQYVFNPTLFKPQTNTASCSVKMKKSSKPTPTPLTQPSCSFGILSDDNNDDNEEDVINPALFKPKTYNASCSVKRKKSSKPTPTQLTQPSYTKKHKLNMEIVWSFEKYDTMTKQQQKLLVGTINGNIDYLNDCHLKSIKGLKINDELLCIAANPKFEINPCVIDAISSCSFDSICQIKDDDRFILIAILIGQNNLFFNKHSSKFNKLSSNKKKSFNIEDEEKIIKNYKPTPTEMNHQYDKIKNRFTKLENILIYLENEKNYSLYLLIKCVIAQILLLLQERIVEFLFSYFSSTPTTPSVEPFDMSFLMPFLPIFRQKSFQNFSKLVEDRKISVFKSVRIKQPVHKYRNLYLLETRSCNQVKHLSVLGMRWNRFFPRVSTYRKEMMHETQQALLSQIQQVRAGNTSTYTRSQDIEEIVEGFHNIHFWDYGDHRFVNIIQRWPLPMSFCSVLLQKELQKERYKNHNLSNKGRCIKIAERVYEEENGENVMKKDNLKFLKYAIFLNDTCSLKKLFQHQKETLNVDDIKYLLRYCIDVHSSESTSLDSYRSSHTACNIISEFKWLLNTWIDDEGNTFIGYCVKHRYPYLSSILGYLHISATINATSREDDLTPAMIAADNANPTFKPTDIIRVLHNHGANLFYVNKNRETILHRAAGANNSIVLQSIKNMATGDDLEKIVELRRKVDNTTPMMIALSRGHCDFAKQLSDICRVKFCTLFGNSNVLRTPEFILLKGVSVSTEFLENQGVEANMSIIKDAFFYNTLFKEEYHIATAGLINIGRQAVEKIDGVKTSHPNKKQFFGGNINRLNESNNTWTALRQSKGHKWVSLLVNGKMDAFINSVEKTTKIFESEDCSICLEKLSANYGFSVNYGSTKCGHQFHTHCWQTMKNTIKQDPSGSIYCPVCRQKTCFRKHTSSLVYDEEEPQQYENLTPSPPTKIWRRIGDNRYEFLINGVYIDEVKCLF